MAFGSIVQMIGGAILPTVVVVAVVGRRWRRSNPTADKSQPTTDDSGLEILNRRALREFLELGGDPRRVSLRSAQLDGVDLSYRNMQRVDLSRSSLRKSILPHICLARARLDYADLSGADLQHADLAGASMVDTNLWRADLRGANLSACGTAGSANLRRALYDKTTLWPPGFDPTMAGALAVPRNAS